MSFTVVIPSRYASSRLPGKPLADIGGKPMVIRVAERAQQSLAHSVVVATDSQEIQAAYDILTNPQRRQQFDNPNPFGNQGFNFNFGGHPFNFENIFNSFGAQFHHPHQNFLKPIALRHHS